MTFPSPPRRLTTDRLVLRCWEVHDAPRLRDAIDRSLPDLLPWIPWAAAEPTTLDQVVERIGRHRATFDGGPEWGYAIYDRQERELLGGIGLFGRIGPRALEVGYWMRSDAAGQGFCSEATRAVTAAAIGMGAAHAEIHCNPLNTGSVRVAAKAGYRLALTRPRSYALPGGEPTDTMIWVYPASAEPWDPAAPA